MEYIPYSTRHNITDTDLAWLLDYLEKDIVANLEHDCLPDYSEAKIIARLKYSSIWIEIDDEYVNIKYDYPITDFSCYYEPFNDMDKDLFFRTYKTLLPVIRDLYSK